MINLLSIFFNFSVWITWLKFVFYITVRFVKYINKVKYLISIIVVIYDFIEILNVLYIGYKDYNIFNVDFCQSLCKATTDFIFLFGQTFANVSVQIINIKWMLMINLVILVLFFVEG